MRLFARSFRILSVRRSVFRFLFLGLINYLRIIGLFAARVILFVLILIQDIHGVMTFFKRLQRLLIDPLRVRSVGVPDDDRPDLAVFIEIDQAEVHVVQDIRPHLRGLGIVAAHISCLDPFLFPARPFFLSRVHAKIQDRDPGFGRTVSNGRDRNIPRIVNDEDRTFLFHQVFYRIRQFFR